MENEKKNKQQVHKSMYINKEKKRYFHKGKISKHCNCRLSNSLFFILKRSELGTFLVGSIHSIGF